MTTILWDGESGTLYADSCSSTRRREMDIAFTTRNNVERKIVTFPASSPIYWRSGLRILAVAGAGNSSVIEFLITYLINHGKEAIKVIRQIPHLKSLSQSDLSASLLVVLPDRVVRLTYSGGSITVRYNNHREKKRMVIGSGSNAATIGIETFRMSADDAMRFARLSDAATGGVIHRYRLDETSSDLIKCPPIEDEGPGYDFNVVRDHIAQLPASEATAVDKVDTPYGNHPLYEELVKRKNQEPVEDDT